jgi:predicted acetyltransferase
MTHSVRRCNIEDKDMLWNILSYAYSIPEASKERFYERLELNIQEFFLNEVDGIPVAAARVIPFEQNVRGVLEPMAGIGMVASSPEYRRLGHSRELLLSIFDNLRKEKYAMSTLYPFKDTFYGELGYVKMPPSKTLELNPNNLSGMEVPIGYTAKREEGEEMQEIRRKLHSAMVRDTHGAVMRSDARWKEMTKNFALKAVVARNGDGSPEGIMIYSIKGYGEGHPWAETGQVHIPEFTWTTLEARDTLLNYLYKHADQIIKATMVISTRADDFYHWITDIHTPVIRSNIVSMARIIDVYRSFSTQHVSTGGSVLIEVKDSRIAGNNKTFELIEENGMIVVKISEKKANTTIKIEGLTSILYGTLNEAQLRRLGWLTGESPSALFDWFPSATPWLTEDF